MKRSFALAFAFAALIAAFSLAALAQQPRPRDLHPAPANTHAAPAPPSAHPPSLSQAPTPEEGARESGGAKNDEAAEEHAPKPINWIDFSNKAQPPLALMFLNFLVLVGIYYKYGKTPISEGLKNRRATVAREIEEAKRMQQEAEARAAKYQEKLSHLEAELGETREALRAAGEGERDRLVREAEEKAARMEKDAAFLVEQELKTLRADLTREAVEIAMAAAEELLRKRITSSDQERLAEDYLAQLAAKRPSGQERGSIAPAPHSEGGE